MMYGLLGFGAGILLALFTLDHYKPPEPIIETKEERISYYEQAFRKAMGSCLNEGHDDYICYHFLVGGNMPKSTPMPTPSPKPHYFEDYQ